MAEIFGSLAAQYITFVDAIFIENYCTIASAVIVIHDHLGTIPQEIHLIWGRKLTSTVILFHTNRWLILIWAILSTVEAFFHPGTAAVSTLILKFCASLYYVGRALQICLFALWAVFSAIRIYALTSGNRLLSFVVALLNLVPVGTNAYSCFYGNNWQLLDMPPFGKQCNDVQNLSEETYIRFIGTRVCVIAADAIVLLVTWLKTWATIRMAHQQNIKTPLMSMLLRDVPGLLSLNILNIVGWITDVFTIASALSTPLSSIIITHFLLDLRQLSHSSDDGNSNPSFAQDVDFHQVIQYTCSSRFGSFVDNMGQSLDYGSEDRDDDMS
ncbi:hypothetical protein CERSUDRAFT_68881 [Gelatoporia subvermispora B]|uniref:DUF6533 domain-containing protein n=1 Tax=Ceriporiopsis subvermispora (strain B) TaxID=914234 RepID=M2QIV1_CERS8|nr:hypothetical protein CERSUDRAFT_68881 [Gelatoporia subvermispora B]